MSLFVRMGRSVRSVFFASDAAQSVELGLSMHKGTLNDVINANLPDHKPSIQVKDVMQTIQMRANHRTHLQNLNLSKAVRKILTRSFQVRAVAE